MAGTLLVIDPSPTVQRVVQLVLGQKGYRVAAAGDLATARAHVTGQIDVLIIAADSWSEQAQEPPLSYRAWRKLSGADVDRARQRADGRKLPPPHQAVYTRSIDRGG